MHGAQRQDHRRHRRRPLVACAAVVMALAAAGCAESSGGTSASSSGPPLVTGEQVVTACFQAYFYNGVLPRTAARTNCRSCVVDQLRTLGIRPTSGENVADMLTGDRLEGSVIQSLQNSCDVSDASSQ